MRWYFPFPAHSQSLPPAIQGMTTTHRAIVGDNLDVLPGLAGERFNLIYLDPPYNTGGKVVREYRDRFDNWTAFMQPRLQQMIPMLADEGILMVSVDDREVHHLRVLLDELMGPRNHVGTVVWEGAALNSSKLLSVSHDYLVLYAREHALLRRRGVRWSEEKPEVARVLEAAQTAWDASDRDHEAATRAFLKWRRTQSLSPGVMEYSRIDEQGRLFRVGDAGAPSKQASRSFRPIIHPSTGRACPVPKHGWRFSDATMDEMLASGRIVFGPDESTLPKPKRLLADSARRTPTSVFRHERTGTKHLEAIIGSKLFPFPKDLDVMMHWIELVAPRNARVLDPFLGSGTTIEAAAALNTADGGSRSVTGITLDEGQIIDDVLRPRMDYVRSAYGQNVQIEAGTASRVHHNEDTPPTMAA